MKTLHILSIMALAMAAVAGNAQLDTRGPVRVVIDGGLMLFPDQQPIQSNGRVLVPLRGVFERLGAEVDWDAPNQTVTAYKRGVRVTLAIGKYDAIVNEQNVHMDSPARLIGGSTMVPLRFVSEALGAEVSWNDAMLEVDITAANTDALLEGRNAQGFTEIYGRNSIGNPRQPLHVAAHMIGANTVIPWSLNNRLSSNGANQGDAFTATLAGDGHTRYLGIPAGSILYGRVGYVRTHQGDNTGVIELRFDRIVTPDGQTIPVQGRLISLSDKSVIRESNGTITARNAARDERAVFAGVSTGPGLIVELQSDRPIADATIGGLLGLAISAAPTRDPGEVILTQGTTFGLMLSNRIVMPDNAK